MDQFTHILLVITLILVSITCLWILSTAHKVSNGLDAAVNMTRLKIASRRHSEDDNMNPSL
jgi:hypothetical protein